MSVESLLPDALSRQDFGFFFRRIYPILNPSLSLKPAWHVDAICHRLSQMTDGELTRLIVNIPPRYMKSQIISVAYPAWLLGRDPGAKILVTGYGANLVEQLQEQFKRLVESDLYRRIFPRMKASTSRSTSTVFRTNQGGCREAIPLGGAITGFGYGVIIIDDPMKAGDARSPVERARVIDTWRDTLYSRLQPKNTGRVILVMQRLHEDDLSGFLLEQGGWDHLELPAIAQKDELIDLGDALLHRRIGDVLCPAWEDAQTLETLRSEVGDQVFRAQYLMDTSVGDGGGVQWSRLHFYDAAPDRDRCEMVVISWDTALSLSQSADYSVGTVWALHCKKWHLLDLVRGKWDGEDLLAQVARGREKWRADQIIIEQAGSGIPLLQRLRREQKIRSEGRSRVGCQHLAINPVMNKADRMLLNVDQLYDGHFLLPRQAPYLEDLRRELTAFPNGRHDDQVDSISQFIIHARGRSVRGELNNQQHERDRRARLARY